MGLDDVKNRQDRIAVKVDENSESIARLEAYQKSNHESFTKLESKIDKLIYCFIAASIGLLITLILR
jgi:hypothetical protein